MTHKRKICFVITSQIHFARSVLLLRELKARSGVDLSIVVGGSANLSNYGNVPALLKKEGLPCSALLTMVVEGGTPSAMSKTVGLAILEFGSVFDGLAPDVVVVRGDRHEVLGAVIAAAYQNIPIAHIEGGDVTGTIDESVRHAISKFSQLHFVTNNDARERVIRMGESSKSVYNVGAPEVEYAAEVASNTVRIDINSTGVGADIDLSKPYIIVMNHPVTTEYGSNLEHTRELLETVSSLGIQTIWFWPNADAGTNEVSEAIRIFREHTDVSNMRFLKYVAPEVFAPLLQNCACLVGNSSAGIKEASYMGVPVVNVGTRQDGRLRAKNVIDVPVYESSKIKNAVQKQIKAKKYPRSLLYFKKGSSKKIADILCGTLPPVQKRFVD